MVQIATDELRKLVDSCTVLSATEKHSGEAEIALSLPDDNGNQNINKYVSWDREYWHVIKVMLFERNSGFSLDPDDDLRPKAHQLMVKPVWSIERVTLLKSGLGSSAKLINIVKMVDRYGYGNEDTIRWLLIEIMKESLDEHFDEWRNNKPYWQEGKEPVHDAF